MHTQWHGTGSEGQRHMAMQNDTPVALVEMAKARMFLKALVDKRASLLSSFTRQMSEN